MTPSDPHDTAVPAEPASEQAAEESAENSPELDETGMPPDAVTTGGTTDADVSDGTEQ